jgi:hypothetical protein
MTFKHGVRDLTDTVVTLSGGESGMCAAPRPDIVHSITERHLDVGILFHRYRIGVTTTNKVDPGRPGRHCSFGHAQEKTHLAQIVIGHEGPFACSEN